MEPDARFYRRRAYEELAAAERAVTPAARDRRIQLARAFLTRLKPKEADEMLFEWGIAGTESTNDNLCRRVAPTPEVAAPSGLAISAASP